MKRINVKKLSIAAAILFGINVAFGATTIAKHKETARSILYKVKNREGADLISVRPDASNKYKVATGLTWSGIKGAYAYNKAKLHYYGSAVIIDEYRVAKLKDDLKVARKNDDKSDKVYLKRNLKKARLDLMRDQIHFIVDKEALRQDYLLTISDQRKELASDRQDLCKAKADLRRDKSNSLLVKKVELKKKEIKADKLAIVNEKADLKKEMESADKIVK